MKCSNIKEQVEETLERIFIGETRDERKQEE